ncbi:MAG: AI-2E family transporter [Methanotrichaceae archaeon]|nr:AI-2E family transporter [Methanotrichaceae archaeon]
MDPGRRFNLLVGVFIFLMVLLTLYLTRDFLFPVLLSVVLVFLLRPLYRLFFQATENRILSSLLSIFLVLVVMVLMLMGMTQVLLREVSNFQTTGLQISSAQSASENMELWLRGNFSEPVLPFLLALLDTLDQIVSDIIAAIKSSLIYLASNLPLYFAQSIVVLFFTFFLLFEGESFVLKAVRLVPAGKRKLVNQFLQELDYIYEHIFSAFVLTALASGILAFFIFFLLNVPYPLVLALVVIIFTLIPLVGAPWVFLPLAAIYLQQGNISLAAALALSGILIFVVPQYLILPRLARRGAQIHPLVTVLAFVGALFAIGLPGIIIGPILYGFLLAVYRTLAADGEPEPEPSPNKEKADQGTKV